MAEKPRAVKLCSVAPRYSVVMMLLGIPTMAAALGFFMTYLFGSQQEEANLRVVKAQHFDADRFDQLDEFTERLEASGVKGMSNDDKISRFEFLCFMLVQNDICSSDNIREAMENFDELDRSSTGCAPVLDYRVTVVGSGMFKLLVLV